MVRQPKSPGDEVVVLAPEFFQNEGVIFYFTITKLFLARSLSDFYDQ